jgi:hypothetical protein
VRKGTGLVIALIAAGMFVPAAMADDLKVELVSVPSNYMVGDQVTIVAQTEPGATCSGTIDWTAERKGANAHSGFNLSRKTADSDGKVTWSWKAQPGPAAKGQLTVTCDAGGKTGKASAQLSRQ